MFQAVRDASERWSVGDPVAVGQTLVQALTNGHLGPGAEEMDDGIVRGGLRAVFATVATADASEVGEGIVDGVTPGHQRQLRRLCPSRRKGL